MLTIRLRRTGKKKKPSYRIVVIPSQKAVYGKYVDLLGSYNPFTKKVILNSQKAMEWMNKGAKPTNAVGKILIREKLEHKSIIIKKFRAVSKKELEAQKAAEEAEKTKLQAEKEAAKAAFAEKVEAEKASQPTAEEKLHRAVEEEIKEEKTEAEKETQEKETKVPDKEEAQKNQDAENKTEQEKPQKS